MDHVIYDFIRKLRVSERGYCFILIMVCVMTCFVFLKPLRTKSAKEVAFTLVNVFANFGVPQILQSQNCGKFWQRRGGKRGTGTVRQQIIRSLAPGPVKL